MTFKRPHEKLIVLLANQAVPTLPCSTRVNLVVSRVHSASISHIEAVSLTTVEDTSDYIFLLELSIKRVLVKQIYSFVVAVATYNSYFVSGLAVVKIDDRHCEIIYFGLDSFCRQVIYFYHTCIARTKYTVRDKFNRRNHIRVRLIQDRLICVFYEHEPITVAHSICLNVNTLNKANVFFGSCQHSHNCRLRYLYKTLFFVNNSAKDTFLLEILSFMLLYADNKLLPIENINLSVPASSPYVAIFICGYSRNKISKLESD